jgi:hypothetical protein
VLTLRCASGSFSMNTIGTFIGQSFYLEPEPRLGRWSKAFFCQS